MKTITFRQCLLLAALIGLALLAWKRVDVCEAKPPTENGRKQMECNEYFFFRATAFV